MRDAFYTILVVWIVWRIANTYSSYSAKRQGNAENSFRRGTSEEGKTTIKYKPPAGKKISDDEGEYVDFEEIK
jgi:hypothetical protein